MAEEEHAMDTCAYCGRERPTNEMTSGKIVVRNYRQSGGIVWVDKLYCSDAECHGYDQIAHLS